MNIRHFFTTFVTLGFAATLTGCAPRQENDGIATGRNKSAAKRASKVFVLAGNWSPTNGEGNQLTFIPDQSGPITGQVLGIFSSSGHYQASEIDPVSGRLSLWALSDRLDSDDPTGKTSFSAQFSTDGKLLTLIRHWGGGNPDETKTYRR